MSLTPNEKKLDKIFAKYIRLKGTKKGYGACYTCGKLCPFEDLDCGHYITREHKGTRWDETNCQIQCVQCNRFKSGASDEFALHLLKDYGQEVLKTLNQAKWLPTKIDDWQVLAMIKDFKEKVKLLLNK